MIFLCEKKVFDSPTFKLLMLYFEKSVIFHLSSIISYLGQKSPALISTNTHHSIFPLITFTLFSKRAQKPRTMPSQAALARCQNFNASSTSLFFTYFFSLPIKSAISPKDQIDENGAPPPARELLQPFRSNDLFCPFSMNLNGFRDLLA